MRLLNTVNGPKDLRKSVQADQIADLLPIMVSGEAPVVGGMPVLGGDDEIEARLIFIGHRDHFVSARHGQSSAGKEVVLDVDQNESVHAFHTANRSLHGTEAKRSIPEDWTFSERRTPGSAGVPPAPVAAGHGRGIQPGQGAGGTPALPGHHPF